MLKELWYQVDFCLVRKMEFCLESYFYFAPTFLTLLMQLTFFLRFLLTLKFFFLKQANKTQNVFVFQDVFISVVDNLWKVVFSQLEGRKVFFFFWGVCLMAWFSSQKLHCINALSRLLNLRAMIFCRLYFTLRMTLLELGPFL